MSMLDHELIDRLGDLSGIPGSYNDWDGTPVAIITENKVPLLVAMGFDMSSNAAVEKAIDHSLKSTWQTLMAPVTVVHQDKTNALMMRFDNSKRPLALEMTITLEDGAVVTHKADLARAEVRETIKLDATEYFELAVALPESLPLGYHRLEITSEGFEAEATLIVAPAVCFEPEAMKQGKKIWGSGIQLYCVRSEHNWGMGDLTDLGALASGLGQQGADFVGLNPVHALYPSNPLHCSPYSPSSRLFDNVLYIDPEQVAEFADCK